MGRRWMLMLGVALAVFVAGCNTFNTTLGTPQNSSTILFLSPAGANVGGGAFTLTVTGGSFANNSLVQWNGSNRTTTFVNSNELLAQITASDIASAGTINIVVYTAGTAQSDPQYGTDVIATSNVVTFSIQAAGAAPPAITGVMPMGETAGGASFTLMVNGTGFITGSEIYWNGSPVATGCSSNPPSPAATTTVNSATSAQVTVPACDIATAETARITVFNPPSGNPATGGGSSNTWSFTVASGGGAVRRETIGDSGISAATSLSPAISSDTRYVAFVAPVPDPTGNASTGTDNIYVRDTCAGAPAGCAPSTALISIAADGSAADGASDSPSMSADGRYVTFVSIADNLVAGGASGLGDIYVRDTCTGAPAGCTPSTTLISAAPDGSFANGPSDSPSISASGRYIVFSSVATNLVPGTMSIEPAIYMRDLCVGAPSGCQAATTLLSVSSAASPSP